MVHTPALVFGDNLFCECEDLSVLLEGDRDILNYSSEYGWFLKWIELSDEDGYTQVNRYAVVISHCPFCGRQLNGDPPIK